jgi:hypothetical protein
LAFLVVKIVCSNYMFHKEKKHIGNTTKIIQKQCGDYNEMI